MSVHYDQDNGPGTVLTEDHRHAIEEGSGKSILSWVAAAQKMCSS
jgi:hypothetical protein